MEQYGSRSATCNFPSRFFNDGTPSPTYSLSMSRLLKTRQSVVAIVFALCCLSILPVHAQFSGLTPSGVNPAFITLFGSNTNFSAKVDITVLDKDGKEWARMPANISSSDQNLRMEIDMGQIVSRDLPEFVRSSIKGSGMGRVVSIVRRDKNATFLMYPGAESYLNLPLSEEDSRAAKQGYTLSSRPVKAEVVDGKERTRNEVAVKNGSGAAVLQATTWTAPELRNFPVQIQTRQDGRTFMLKFSDVALTKPAAALFNVPGTYTEYKDLQKMMYAIMTKMVAGSTSSTGN